jgi:hypothetical protein
MKRKTKTTSVRGATDADVHPRGKIKPRSLVTEEMVEQRAREIALISGREPNHVLGSDRIQAKKELLGDPSRNDPADEPNIVTRGMGAPPTSRGKRTEPRLPKDDMTTSGTVQEGIDEAEHDEMLEASKTQTRSEG